MTYLDLPLVDQPVLYEWAVCLGCTGSKPHTRAEVFRVERLTDGNGGKFALEADTQNIYHRFECCRRAYRNEDQ